MKWEDDDLVYEFDGWSVAKLQAQRGRAHFLLAAPYRYVSVILLPPSTSYDLLHTHFPQFSSPTHSSQRELLCMDSPCYHAAGPLGEGELVELEDLAHSPSTAPPGSGPARELHASASMLCIVCPWHRYLVSLETGEEVFLYPAEEGGHPDGVPGGPTHRLRTLTREGSSGSAATSRVTPPITFHDGQTAHIRMGQKVQRLHRAVLDERTGVLTIAVKDYSEALQKQGSAEGGKEKREAMKVRGLVKSDALATSLKNGGLCVQIQDIKAKGLDQL